MVIFGCGYVGMRLAHRCLASQLHVTGIVRTPDSHERLRRAGIAGLRCDIEHDDPRGLPFAGARVFHLAPPSGQGREDFLTRALIDAFQHTGQPRRILYISTTGVYGDCQGAWIDENQAENPGADRSWRRLDAEQMLRRWSLDSGGELTILRVAGIYGPGRLPIERIRSGQPLVRPDESPYSNRIHVDDLVSVCMAAMEKGINGAVYNVSDGSPSTMTEYFLQIAAAADLPVPPLIPMAEASAHLSSGMLTYMRESRRLINCRMCEELGVRLRYPTLKEGLRNCFESTARAPA